MECFAIIVNGFQPLSIITKRSILDVAVALDPPLLYVIKQRQNIWMEIKPRDTNNKLLESESSTKYVEKQNQNSKS